MKSRPTDRGGNLYFYAKPEPPCEQINKFIVQGRRMMGGVKKNTPVKNYGSLWTKASAPTSWAHAFCCYAHTRSSPAHTRNTGSHPVYSVALKEMQGGIRSLRCERLVANIEHSPGLSTQYLLLPHLPPSVLIQRSPWSQTSVPGKGY